MDVQKQHVRLPKHSCFKITVTKTLLVRKLTSEEFCFISNLIDILSVLEGFTLLKAFGPESLLILIRDRRQAGS